MIYVFDTSSFNELSPLIPDVFPTFWAKFAEALEDGEITSTREVLRELANGPQHHVVEWCNRNKGLFATPDARETAFVAKILAVPHFAGLIGEKQRLRGTPVADPFLIARASVLNATVVSEESVKPNKPNIPAVCGHFGVPCIKLSDFFRAKGWSF